MESKLNEIQRLGDRIRYILENRPEARDNDRLIYAQLLVIWLHKNGYALSNVTGKQFINIITSYKGVPNIGSVVRARALLQERNPELRGKYYGERRRLGEQTRGEFGALKLDLQQFDPELRLVKPVPCSCGGAPVLTHVSHTPEIWVSCERCGESSSKCITADETALAWNNMQTEINGIYKQSK